MVIVLLFVKDIRKLYIRDNFLYAFHNRSPGIALYIMSKFYFILGLSLDFVGTLRYFKGNLAHKLTGLYFLCFSFRLDIFNTLNAKIVEILINLGATHGRKFNLEILLILDFPMTTWVTSLP